MKTQRPEEYLKDPVNVRRIIQKMLRLKFEELVKPPVETAKFLFNCVDAPIRREWLDESQMEIIDLLALIRGIEQDEEYGDAYCDSHKSFGNTEQYLYSVCQLMNYLCTARKQIAAIDRFLTLPVKAFYDALEQEVHTGELVNEYRFIERQFKEKDELHRGVGGLSIGELLVFCEEKIRKPWIPGCYDPEHYADRIRETYRLAGRLLIRSFSIVYPERFCMDDIRKKYALDDDEADDDMLYDPE